MINTPFAELILKTYFRHSPSTQTIQRALAAGVWLLVVSAWALFTACQILYYKILGTSLGFYPLDFILPLNSDSRYILTTYIHWYALLLLVVGVGGLTAWRDSNQSHHLQRVHFNLLAFFITIMVVPSYSQSLIPFLAIIGGMFVANIVSVLLTGKTLSEWMPKR